MLIIRSLAGSRSQIHNLSDSDDTRVLLDALEGDAPSKDVSHAGTAMRFLAAYLTTREGEFLLTGSDRMKERPIGPLVAALQTLGADIAYQEKEGYPPLKIRGGTLRGGNIKIAGGISSQFISALMMVGPVLDGGLVINLTGDIVSATYIEMTLALMQQCGVNASFDGREIIIPRQPYTLKDFRVESDWSGASYWYQIAALLPGSEIGLPDLNRHSLQGDAVLATLFRPLGVQSHFIDEGVMLQSLQEGFPERLKHDFTGYPDLVQTCAVTLCALGIPFRFTGTSTLRIKETDRIAALQRELQKVGFVLEFDNGGEWISWDGTRCVADPHPVIGTYHDHRMAMAFAPLAIPLGQITIDDPLVVTKSYPGYWSDLKKAGFTIRT